MIGYEYMICFIFKFNNETKKMATLTLAQKIAQSEDKTARLKEQSRKLENGQKIIMGGAFLSRARKDDRFAEIALDTLRKELGRDYDLKRMEPIMAELQAIVSKAQEDDNRPM